MTKTLSLLKPLLIASYTLVFLAGLGAFSSTMGCMLDKQGPKLAKKVATQKLLLVAHSQGNFYANSTA